MTKLSRKEFLKGAAVSAVGVAALSTGFAGAAEEAAPASAPTPGYICPEDWLGEAPVIPEEEIKATYTADVIVCGGGHAGIQAGLGAIQEGVSVMVLESQDPDLFSCFGDDICSYNSKFLTERGFGGYNLSDITAEYVRRGGGRVSAEIIRLFVENSGEMLDNMVSCIPETSNVFDFENHQAQVQIAYGMPDASYYPIERGGFKAWATTIQTIGNKNATPVLGREGVSRLTELQMYCMDAAQKLGAEWFFNTRATVLEQNENGDVTGVIAEDMANGGYVRYVANKGVILATGDFSGNPDMVYNLLTDVNEGALRAGATREEMGGRGRDGQGHKMGCWAGGYVEQQPRPSMNTNGGNPGPWGTAPFLWLNAHGKRFMNETMAGFAKPTILKQPKGIVAAICDANYQEVMQQAGLDHGAPNYGAAGVDGLHVMDLLDEQMKACLGKGAEGGKTVGTGIINISLRQGTTVFAAETIEELLGYLGYEGAALEQALKTIEEYNAMCDAGVDSQYGKEGFLMKPIRTAPFYGSVSENTGKGSAGLVTLAGLITDDQLNVLDAEGEPIKGLYATGNCLGQRFGIAYSTPSAGASMGMAMTHGRLCGKIVAKL